MLLVVLILLSKFYFSPRLGQRQPIEQIPCPCHSSKHVLPVVTRLQALIPRFLDAWPVPCPGPALLPGLGAQSWEHTHPVHMPTCISVHVWDPGSHGCRQSSTAGSSSVPHHISASPDDRKLAPLVLSTGTHCPALAWPSPALVSHQAPLPGVFQPLVKCQWVFLVKSGVPSGLSCVVLDLT